LFFRRGGGEGGGALLNDDGNMTMEKSDDEGKKRQRIGLMGNLNSCSLGGVRNPKRGRVQPLFQTHVAHERSMRCKPGHIAG
jgi:hypothetical protein